MHGRGECMAGWAYMAGVACVVGACVTGGVHGRGACVPHMPPSADTRRYGQ